MLESLKSFLSSQDKQLENWYYPIHCSIKQTNQSINQLIILQSNRMVHILDVPGAGKSYTVYEAINQLPWCLSLKARGNGSIIGKARDLLAKFPSSTSVGVLCQDHLRPLCYSLIATCLSQISKNHNSDVSS